MKHIPTQGREEEAMLGGAAPATPNHGPWGHHLVRAEAGGTQPPRTSPAGLSAAEAQRVERYHQRLLAALRAKDRRALQTAKQAVLRSAYREPATAALRRALRELSWCMAGMLLPR
ncbi:MAG: hypothetical protein O9331_12300 [Acidovorax sp.]|nr:hypothetical protein [Acidovorax sp.]